MGKQSLQNETQFAQLTGNARFDLVRYETLEDEQYLVVPVVMIVEGVLSGSAGPILYVKDEIASLPSAWNSKPVVVNHPAGETATTKAYRDSNGIGQLMNTGSDNKGPNGLTRLVSETWLKESRVQKIDSRILEAIKNRQMVEVSTGLWFKFEGKEGEFNGVKYNGIARDIVPDHLAILPDSIGASSIADGAGLVRNEKTEDDKTMSEHIYFSSACNEMSDSHLRDLLTRAIREEYANKPDEWVWIEAVYSQSQFFIYEDKNGCGKRKYRLEADNVIFEGEPEKVIRITEYRTVDGAFVGNSAKNNIEEKTNMEKSEIVNALIKNRGWSEDKRESLMKADEYILNALNAEPQIKEVTVEKTVEVKQAINTREDLIEAIADDALKSLVENGLKKLDEEKQAVVKKILSAENNLFSEDELNAESLERLNKMVSLVVKAKNQNFAGSVDPVENESEPTLPKLDLPKN